MENHNYYVVITSSVLLDKTLSDKQKLLIGLITNLSNIKGYCFASNKYLAECLCCSEKTICALISDLEDRFYVGRVLKIKSDNSVEFRSLTVLPPPLKNEDTPPQIQGDPSPQKWVHNNKEIKNISFTISNIVEYLNEKSKKQFNSKSKANAAHISARLREGFKIEDFKRVIDYKCEQWLNDEKMQKYIRPETLFGSKFDGYLNEAPKKMIESDIDHDKRARETLSPLAYQKLYGRQ